MLKFMLLLLLLLNFGFANANCYQEADDGYTPKSGEWPLPFKQARFPIEEVEGVWQLGENEPLLKINYIEFKNDKIPYHSLELKLLDPYTGVSIAKGLGKLHNDTVSATLYFKDGREPIQLKLKSFYSGKHNLVTNKPIIVFVMNIREKGDVGEGKFYRASHIEDECY